jgi:hypothetical protein
MQARMGTKSASMEQKGLKIAQYQSTGQLKRAFL